MITRASESTPTATRFVTSADGTPIAYEVRGAGPALVLVDGALCHRSMGPARGLAEQLAAAFTVYAYDRRGRGDSGPGAAYAVAREVEDLVAVLGATGGPAHVFGASSGATLALEAARVRAPIDRLAVYESPFIVDGTRPPNDPRLPEMLDELVASGRRGDAVRAFMRTVGAPRPVIAAMRFMPAWKQMTAAAHTLPHDLSIVVPHQQGQPLPAGYYDQVDPETLVIAGGRSPAYMRNAQAAITDALPHARLETLTGQTHMIKPKVVAPLLTRFLRREFTSDRTA